MLICIKSTYTIPAQPEYLNPDFGIEQIQVSSTGEKSNTKYYFTSEFVKNNNGFCSRALPGGGLDGKKQRWVFESYAFGLKAHNNLSVLKETNGAHIFLFQGVDATRIFLLGSFMDVLTGTSEYHLVQHSVRAWKYL